MSPLFSTCAGLSLLAATHVISPGRSLAAESEPVLAERIAKEYPSLEQLYQDLHSHPELSFQEAKTGARLAAQLQQLGLEVTSRVGGHGVVGVLRNGAGPTLLVRTDLDALPVKEQLIVELYSK